MIESERGTAAHPFVADPVERMHRDVPPEIDNADTEHLMKSPGHAEDSL